MKQKFSKVIQGIRNEGTYGKEDQEKCNVIDLAKDYIATFHTWLGGHHIEM